MKPARKCRDCDASISRYERVCNDCSAQRHVRSRYLSGQMLAGSLVAAARKRGELADPRTLDCTDCGVSATEYDHRDYNEPLRVDPVCRGCNARRGTAIPKRWHPEEWRAYAERCIESSLRCGRVTWHHDALRRSIEVFA